MDKKQVAIIIVIIGICIGIIAIVFSKMNKAMPETEVSLRNVVENLTLEEKEELINYQNGDKDAKLPDAVKDVIFPKALQDGVSDLLNNKK